MLEAWHSSMLPTNQANAADPARCSGTVTFLSSLSGEGGKKPTGFQPQSPTIALKVELGCQIQEEVALVSQNKKANTSRSCPPTRVNWGAEDLDQTVVLVRRESDLMTPLLRCWFNTETWSLTTRIADEESLTLSHFSSSVDIFFLQLLTQFQRILKQQKGSFCWYTKVYSCEVLTESTQIDWFWRKASMPGHFALPQKPFDVRWSRKWSESR